MQGNREIDSWSRKCVKKAEKKQQKNKKKQ